MSRQILGAYFGLYLLSLRKPVLKGLYMGNRREAEFVQRVIALDDIYDIYIYILLLFLDEIYFMYN